MKIQTSIDFSRKRLVISITSNLFTDYYPHFEGLVGKESGNKLPDKTEVVRQGKDTAMLSFPIPMSPETAKIGDEVGDNQVQKIGVPMDLYNSVMGFIYLFTDKVIKNMDKTREYLPLKGYPEDELKKDVIKALEAKRDLLIIDTYSAWINGMKTGERSFNQYLVKYKTQKSEYCDIVLMIMNGKFKEWRKKYKPQLAKVCWI
jgi:hypothetical protein